MRSIVNPGPDILSSISTPRHPAERNLPRSYYIRFHFNYGVRLIFLFDLATDPPTSASMRRFQPECHTAGRSYRAGYHMGAFGVIQVPHASLGRSWVCMRCASSRGAPASRSAMVWGGTGKLPAEKMLACFKSLAKRTQEPADVVITPNP